MAELRRYDRLPAGLQSAMQLYIERAIPPGGFLTAVLSNDLRGACARADDINRHELFAIVSWLYNNAPTPCWGSPERVEKWLQSRNSG